MQSYRGNIVDVRARTIFCGQVQVERGKITDIVHLGEEEQGQPYLLPGLVDAHVHIESSMLTPDEFGRAALRHGVLASVSDPHEIANVLGVAGIDYMRERASLTPFTILFGAPSCVPATPFESAGAAIDAGTVRSLLESGKTGYLSEVMNFPGVLARDPEVMEKINAAKALGLPIDGHAPGLLKADAKQYADAGISTDHECTNLEEAIDKINAGMKILIREGSAAKDFESLHSLIDSHCDNVMLCSDDKHPDDLLEGHIDLLVKRALEKGHDLFNVLQTATVNPITHYQMKIGLLQIGDSFDAIQVNNLTHFKTQKVWLKGELVVNASRCLLTHKTAKVLNHFAALPLTETDLKLPHPQSPCRVIIAEDGKLFTRQEIHNMPCIDEHIAADLDNDILFLAVLNRYQHSAPAVALIKGFTLTGANKQGGAIASSVAHDSHNIVAVGTSANWLSKAINAVIEEQGGLVAIDQTGELRLPLPVAGLMSDAPIEEVGPAYRALNDKAKAMGSQLSSPFMTLSFMSLLVIPALKLSDKGLFDGSRFEFCDLAVAEEDVAP
jgi:adenine deaminase